MQDFIDEFIQDKLSDDTRKNYSGDLRRISEYLGKPIIECTPDELKAYIIMCRDKPLSPVTIGRYKASLASYFKWLMVNEKMKSDPSALARSIETGKKSKINPKALNKENAKKVMDSLKWEDGIHEYQISLAVLFGFQLGFRRMEIAKAEWSHINWDDQEIFVLGKGNKEATVGIPDGQDDLLDRLKVYKMLTDKAKIDSRWIFYKKDNPSQRHQKHNIYKWYKIINKRCGFGKELRFSPHSGRHGFCTALNDAGIPILTAIKMSRHEKPDMFSRYARIDKKPVKDALKKTFG